MFESAELEELMRKAAGDDVGLATHAELLAAVPSLARVRAMLDAAEMHVLAELDVRKVTDTEFGLKTVAWVAHVTRGDRRPIASRLAVGRKLRRLLEGVDAALSAGDLSFEHARALASVANGRIDTEI